MKKIICLFAIVILSLTSVMAQECNFKRPDIKELRKIDKLLNDRLNFTPEQKVEIRKNHTKFKHKMDKVIDEMQSEHEKIRDIYLSGIPPFQAQLKSAPHKAKLVLLKQEADNLRKENRKQFEQLLDENQKAEFEKIKIELSKSFKNAKKPPVD